MIMSSMKPLISGCWAPELFYFWPFSFFFSCCDYLVHPHEEPDGEMVHLVTIPFYTDFHYCEVGGSDL